MNRVSTTGEARGTKEATGARVLAETAPDGAAGTPATATPGNGSITRPSWLSISTLALIGANLLPLAGTMLFGWTLGEVMVLYWAESGVIGIFNLFKMWVIGRWRALFPGLFFVVHFGGFMAGHFLFIYSLFVSGPHGGAPGDGLSEVPGILADLWPALAALFISHGVSLFSNFLGRGEYIGRKVKDQMALPYQRIIIMHITIILGGGLILASGNDGLVLMLLIVLKIGADLKAHLKEHRSREV